MTKIMWFREDLRITDNLALYYASQAASESQSCVVAVFFLHFSFWKKHAMSDRRVRFLQDGLVHLNQQLATLNIPLFVYTVDSTNDIVGQLQIIVENYRADAIFFNHQYEIDEIRRDEQVIQALQKQSIQCKRFHDQTILTPGTVLTHQQDYFKVFTPFKRAWQHLYAEKPVVCLPLPKKQKPIMRQTHTAVNTHIPFLSQSEFDQSWWPPGEAAAKSRLRQFIQHKMTNYASTRDFPATAGTSLLSPYLSAGMISPRICFAAAFTANQQEIMTGDSGALTWMNELIWRDFYKHILYALPSLSMHKAYKKETERIEWRFVESEWEAWKSGQTGYPIIDAGMRQLNKIGWMHNRLRMITAMFLTKNMLFDWRLGENYFMEQLIDGDLAANNGGWQWCASTGTDAVPYFRVFNPVTQSERFDPQGDFIRQYCPEIRQLDNKAIHDPYGRAPMLARKSGYPEPWIDLSTSRLRAIDCFKRLAKD